MEKIELSSFLKLTKDDIKGKIVIFPTDTVYGVGALYQDNKGINKNGRTNFISKNVHTTIAKIRFDL